MRIGRGTVSGQVQLAAGPTHEIDEFTVDDLYELLVGREASQNVLTDRAFADPGQEVLDDLEVDVGFEERHAHVAQGFVDIRLGDLPGAADTAKDVFEFVGEGVEHSGGGDRLGLPCIQEGPGRGRLPVSER